MPETVVRRAMLERMSSPEQLDALMPVTTPRGWLALAAAGVALVGALIWGIFGRLPEMVNGSGILVYRGGLFNIQATGAGQVDRLLVDLRSRVGAGQPVATIAQPELQARLKKAEAELRALQSNLSSSSDLAQKNLALELLALNQEQRQAQEGLAAAKGRAQYLESRVAAEREALSRGLTTEDQLQNVQAQLAATRDQEIGAQAQTEQLRARALSLRNSTNQALFQSAQQVALAEADLQQLRSEYDREAVVRSPYAGDIVELLVDAGETVQPGAPVMRVELADVPLEALLFVVGEGKRIEPGMRALILPDGIKAEEWGYIVARVTDVSVAPLSSQAVNRYLRNESLSERFQGGGGAYLVRLQPERDPRSHSGFRWTSGKGPRVQFGAGALLAGRVTVVERRPIALIIPSIRKLAGSGR